VFYTNTRSLSSARADSLDRVLTGVMPTVEEEGMRRPVVIAMGLLVAGAVFGTPGAVASFPGTNGRIVFTSDRNGDTDIYSANPDGSDVFDLTQYPDTDQTPAVSADGKRVAFATFRDGRSNIYVMNANGSEQTQLTGQGLDTSSGDWWPTWSPDGSRIAFESSRGSEYQVWVVNTDGSGLVRLTSTWGLEPAWSPDGSKIAYVWAGQAGTVVSVMNADGSGQHRLTSGGTLTEYSPSWSPDGRKIAFVRSDGLYVIGADGSGERQLTTDGSQPIWSPDGTRIAFQRRLPYPQLYVMDADGTNVSQLFWSSQPNGLADWSVATTDVAPGISIVMPPQDTEFLVGQPMPAVYFCASLGGPPVVSCDGTAPFATLLDTASVGTKSFMVTATDAAGHTTTRTNTYDVVPPDVTPPVITIDSPRDGAQFALGQVVTAAYGCNDAESWVRTCVGTVSYGAALDTGSPGTKSFTVTATDIAGNTATLTHAYTVVAPDVTPPEITITSPQDGAQLLLGQSVSAAWGCADSGGSGLATCRGTTPNGVPLDTASIGTKSLTVTATDAAGNTSTRTHAYSVVYRFDGFQSVEPFPTLNAVNPGEDVPIRFSLGGNQGLDVLAGGSPTSQPTPCNATDPLSDGTPASGKLQYAAKADRYTYLWTTSKAWAGTCRQLIVVLRDGTVHRASFKLTK
jgi:Tol biopolymer transport system component